MTETRTFRARIEASEGGGAYVTVPFDVEAVFGAKRVPVQATIDGEAYRGSLVRMGGECHVLGVLKEIRERLGKQPGDEVEVVVRRDDAPRTVEVPADLRAALVASPHAAAFFATLSYSAQRNCVRGIEEARRAETRHVRIGRAIELMNEGIAPR